MKLQPLFYVRKQYGGEGGIRTHGGFHLAGFQDQSLKPLDHLSGSTVWIIIKIYIPVNG